MAKLDLGFAAHDWVVVRIGALPDLLALQSELERVRVPVKVQLESFEQQLGGFVGESALYVPRSFVEDAERVAQRLDPVPVEERDTAPFAERDSASVAQRDTAPAAPRADVLDETPRDDATTGLTTGDALPTAAETLAPSSPPNVELERTRALARRIRYCMPSLIFAPVSLALAPRYLRSPRRRDLMKTERWTTDVAVALALPASLLAVALLWMLVEELAPLRDLFR